MRWRFERMLPALNHSKIRRALALGQDTQGQDLLKAWMMEEAEARSWSAHFLHPCGKLTIPLRAWKMLELRTQPASYLQHPAHPVGTKSCQPSEFSYPP